LFVNVVGRTALFLVVKPNLRLGRIRFITITETYPGWYAASFCPMTKQYGTLMVSYRSHV